MEDYRIESQDVVLALQKFTASEISRLYTEIAGRDAFIEKLLIRIEELEGKTDGQG